MISTHCLVFDLLLNSFIPVLNFKTESLCTRVNLTVNFIPLSNGRKILAQSENPVAIHPPVGQTYVSAQGERTFASSLSAN